MAKNMCSCNVIVLLLSFVFLITNYQEFNNAYSLSFNVLDINPNNKASFNLSRDASISSDGLQLTPPNGYKIGWATYATPLHLWDSVSRNMASFSTRFSFMMMSNTTFSEAFTFGLMAPPGPKSSNYSSYFDSWPIFVEVAFYMSTSSNDSNLSGIVQGRVDVDINDTTVVRSTNAALFLNRVTDVWISYDADSITLEVNFMAFGSGSLSCQVDLRSVLPQYVAIGFSSERSSGIDSIKSWDFASTSLQVDANLPSAAPSPERVALPSDSPSTNSTFVIRNKGKGNNKMLLVVGLGVGLSSMALVTFGLIVCCLWRKKKQKKDGARRNINPLSIDEEFEKGVGPKNFSFGELALATNNFSEQQKLGEGGFGGVYRGFLNEIDTAVKKVSSGSRQGLKEYESEVKIISQLRHKNLVQLLGWCHERGELLLVYKFMPNRSLDYHLFDQDTTLAWHVRYKIAQGLADALLYLHEGWEKCVLHRDIKTSNVMLDSNFDAKLGDFGLARLVDHEKGAQTTALAGTLGYVAPEYIINGRASKESDVYSFGVVLLEIACGRKATFNFADRSDPMRLVQWVWNLYAMDKLLDAIDPKLREENINAQEIETFLVVGLWCVHPEDSRRPKMRQVVNVLNFEAPLPSRHSLMTPLVSDYMTPSIALPIALSTESSTGMGSSLAQSSGVNTFICCPSQQEILAYTGEQIHSRP